MISVTFKWGVDYDEYDSKIKWSQVKVVSNIKTFAMLIMIIDLMKDNR